MVTPQVGHQQSGLDMLSRTADHLSGWHAAMERAENTARIPRRNLLL